MSENHDTNAELQERAEKKGAVVFEADEHGDLLTLDIDTPLTEAHQGALCSMTSYIEGYEKFDTVSPGGRLHRYIRLPRMLPITERIALQAALGSDPKREVYNTLRVIRGVEPVCAMFETPQEYERLQRWLAGEKVESPRSPYLHQDKPPRWERTADDIPF